MSEEQLTALLAKLNEDAELREKLKGAADLDAALAIAQEAGFNVSKSELLSEQTAQAKKLSDAELERLAGGAVAGMTRDGYTCADWVTGNCRCGENTKDGAPWCE